MSVRNVSNEELSVSKANNKKAVDIFLFLAFLYFLSLSFVFVVVVFLFAWECTPENIE